MRKNVSMDWLKQLIRTHLERDNPQMGFRVPANRLRRLWTVYLHRILNQKQYIFALRIAPATAVNLLVSIALSHTRRGQFWHAKAGSILDAN
jgi:hypothetical protein